MRSPQFYAGVVRAIMIFSILCHLVGFSAPGWLCLKRTVMVGDHAYKETDNVESYGVWFAIQCATDEAGASQCHPENYYTTDYMYDSLTFSPSKSWILQWQLKTTAALVACIFGAVFVHVQRNLLLQYRPGQEPPKKVKYVIALICSAVAGSLLSWPVGQFFRLNQFYQKSWFIGITTAIPYALIAAGVGAFLNWVCVLILLIILCKRMCIPAHPQMVMVPPTNQQQMIPLMQTQSQGVPRGYADPVNPMYQAQPPYQAPPQGHYPGEHTQGPPGQQYYQPPMYPQMDTKPQPEGGQYYPQAQQYAQYQYNPQTTEDSRYWQPPMPT